MWKFYEQENSLFLLHKYLQVFQDKWLYYKLSKSDNLY